LRTLINFVCVVGSLTILSVGAQDSGKSPTGGETERARHNCIEFGGAGKSPHFTIEKQYHSGGGAHPLNLYVTLPEESIGTRDLVNFSCRINQDFQSEPLIDAYIFDDKKTAKNIALSFKDQEHYFSYLWHLKARYHLDRERKQEFVEYVFPELQDFLLSVRPTKMWLEGGPN
jgi:hypothetical protein